MEEKISKKEPLLNRFYWFLFLLWIMLLYAAHQLIMYRTINRWPAHIILELFYFVLLLRAGIGVLLKPKINKKIWIWALIALVALPFFDRLIGGLCDKYIKVKIKQVPSTKNLDNLSRPNSGDFASQNGKCYRMHKYTADNIV